MMTIGHIPGEFPGQGSSGMQPGAADGAQNAPGAPGAAGAPSEQEVDYLQNADPKDDTSSPAPEDPRRREARLKRRRRLLAIGGVPAALVTIISLAGNRAAAAGHYDTARSRLCEWSWKPPVTCGVVATVPCVRPGFVSPTIHLYGQPDKRFAVASH